MALMNKLEKQTANPGKFLTGDTKAPNKTRTILSTIDELVRLSMKIDDMSDVEEVNA